MRNCIISSFSQSQAVCVNVFRTILTTGYSFVYLTESNHLGRAQYKHRRGLKAMLNGANLVS